MTRTTLAGVPLRADGTLPPLAGGDRTTDDPRARLRQLREQRLNAHERLDRVLTTAIDENRGLTAEEQREHDVAQASYDSAAGLVTELERELRDAPSDWARSEHMRAILPDSEGEGQADRGASVRLLGRSDRVSSRMSGDGAESWRDGNLSIGGALRGLITGRWDGAEEEQRALTSTTLGQGGALVPTPLATGIIDRVRDEARVLEAGAQTVVMPSETLKMPRLTDDPKPAWRNQNEPVAEDDAVFDQVELHAKTLAVMLRYPWELGQDMTPEAMAVIENSLVSGLGQALDIAALRGSGEEVVVGGVTGEEPLGVRNQPGVTILSLGADGGPLDNYRPFIAGVGALRARNHRATAQIYSTRTEMEIANWAAADGQPLNPPAILADVRQLSTNAIPDDIVQGASVDTSEIYTGDWSQMIIGFRPQIGIQVVRLDQTFADRMQIGLLAYLRADVALTHAAAFAVTTGVRPAA